MKSMKVTRKMKLKVLSPTKSRLRKQTVKMKRSSVWTVNYSLKLFKARKQSAV